MSRIRADQLVNRAGSGGPKFPNGVAEGFSVSGIVTATSYRGDGSQLTGIDASSLKDASNVKVQAVSGGANVTGNLAATGNVSAVNATFSGDLTVYGTTTTIDTAVTAVDSLAVEGNVGIGTDGPTAESGFTKVLHVYDDAPQVLLERETGGGDVKAGFNVWSGNASLETFTATPLRIRTSGNTNQLYLNTNGNIGINKDAPTSVLDVRQTNTGAATEIKLFNLDQSNATTQTAALVMTPDVRANGVKIVAVKEVADMSSSANKDLALTFQTVVNNTAVERLRITSGGDILPGADNTQDLGSSAKRFANIYTGDLNLSNEGSANDVDGTWGQYTIQEGEDDLFLINRRTGKKYKFNLTEVN